MVPPEKILQSFLNDALRLSAEGRECVNQLTEQASKQRVSPAQVRSLYQIVHTLKGTAGLVEGAEDVVEALHGIEGRLACQNVVESARHFDWIEQARHSLEQVHVVLLKLQRMDRFSGPLEPLVRGFLLRSTLMSGKKLIWVPLGCVNRVLGPEEMGASNVLRIEGEYVPVLRPKSRSTGVAHFGVAIRSGVGRAVLAVDEVVGVIAWSEASRQGAGSALELFESGELAKPRRKPAAIRKAA